MMWFTISYAVMLEASFQRHGFIDSTIFRGMWLEIQPELQKVRHRND